MKLEHSNTFRQKRRAAFSLAELVVSVGVLTLMLLLVGEVMTLTVKSTGQARAVATIAQRLRVVEEELREDLRTVRPGESLMLIQGNVAKAYWTQAGKDADVGDGNPQNGYPHSPDPEREDPYDMTNRPANLALPRQDMLMFFTARPSRSYIHPQVTSQLQQVVIGHARLGEYLPEPNGVDTDGDGGPYKFSPEPEFAPNAGTQPNQLRTTATPAEGWLLARRVVHVLPPPIVGISPNAKLYTTGSILSQQAGLTRMVLRGQEDVVEDFNYVRDVLTPLTPPWKGGYPETGGPPWYLPGIFAIQGSTPENWITVFQRSELDLSPPGAYGRRAGAHFLPNCASFKVEWALDPKSAIVGGRLDGETEILWVDPGDIGHPNRPNDEEPNAFTAFDKKIAEYEEDGDFDRAAALEDLINGVRDGVGYSLSDRFRSDPDWRLGQPAGPQRTNTHVFTATRRNAAGDIVPEDVFPSALRITVDVFDDERRLDRPTRHVMIIPVGG